MSPQIWFLIVLFLGALPFLFKVRIVMRDGATAPSYLRVRDGLDEGLILLHTEHIENAKELFAAGKIDLVQLESRVGTSLRRLDKIELRQDETAPDRVWTTYHRGPEGLASGGCVIDGEHFPPAPIPGIGNIGRTAAEFSEPEIQAEIYGDLDWEIR